MSRRFLAALAASALMAQAPAPSPPPSPAPPSTPGAMSPPDAWVPRNTAELVMLDKMRGQSAPLSVPAGQSGRFGPLAVAVRSCVARPPDLPQNAAAFVEVTNEQAGKTLFRGWVLANTPSVSQMEDAVFDMRLLACR